MKHQRQWNGCFALYSGRSNEALDLLKAERHPKTLSFDAAIASVDLTFKCKSHQSFNDMVEITVFCEKSRNELCKLLVTWNAKTVLLLAVFES